ncbi:twin-arginine translocation signal domain-containing protein [Bradyrhizobium barranii subsp. apii]|uniref:Twin-arginine translocation signal domain-containing protein n=1 Tax=Bradyrhizobium barranii subsp. apii TaxID=2819348 RepID=A0A8T5VMW8_9BRAD|nr:twin-arginine translocation signal domain-containing protein [Bradyrhizobium barranii]UPT89788.1 twin-arginine translocation signal domain-containing protein [Bradyrhizobium barranii subsp. apii]UPT94185.1 twin-arginine translocation signal domain-containing protein [Bradyrhizobium barranii subsp. apii]
MPTSRRQLLKSSAAAAAALSLDWTRAQAQAENLRIGLIYDLTGPFAAGGSVASSIGPLIAVCCQAYISELAHGTEVVLAPSELVRVAETARARLIRALPARHWIAGAG